MCVQEIRGNLNRFFQNAMILNFYKSLSLSQLLIDTVKFVRISQNLNSVMNASTVYLSTF